MVLAYDTLKVGDKDSISKKITSQVVEAFADVSEDNNPLHLDDTYAKETQFGRRIAHGMISAGLISAIIGTKLPGIGSIYMSQDLQFRRPVYIDDTITAWAEIIEKKEEKKIIILKTWVENQNKKIVVEGEAKVLFKA